MPKTHKETRFLLIVAMAALAACAPPRFASPPGQHDYRQGWHEGCADGYAVAGSPLYEQKFAAAPAAPGVAFESGWQSGYNHCFASFGRIQRTINSVLSPS
ncbi:MAG TPA: hypothetical protein VED46_00910 [Alphaproteobacteria bacterium]|nr:hypothetical protein [Alphaproteobacteria bacterium]